MKGSWQRSFPVATGGCRKDYSRAGHSGGGGRSAGLSSSAAPPLRPRRPGSRGLSRDCSTPGPRSQRNLTAADSLGKRGLGGGGGGRHGPLVRRRRGGRQRQVGVGPVPEGGRREPLFEGGAGSETARRVSARRRWRGNGARGSQDFREQFRRGRLGVRVQGRGGEDCRCHVPPDDGRELGRGPPGRRRGAAAHRAGDPARRGPGLFCGRRGGERRRVRAGRGSGCRRRTAWSTSLGEGEAITACVWKYGQADADAITEGTGEKASFQRRRD